MSNVEMNSEKVEGLCFPLLFSHGEAGYINNQKDCICPSDYAIARMLRPEKINGQYMAAVARYSYDSQIIDGSTGLGWEFQFLVPISGTPIISRIPIPFLVPKIPVGFFFNSNVWRVRKLEFRFAKFGIPVICFRRNSVCIIIASLY
jgi:hypothetical protein